MTGAELLEKVKTVLGEAVQHAELSLGDAVVHILPTALPKVARILKEDPDLAFDYLSDIRGMDYLNMEREPRFEAVYELHSIGKNQTIRIRVGIPEDKPTVPSVAGLWRSAVFPERELHDMFGIRIEGLADQRRLIMPENWEGHPLLKDYQLTTEPVTFSFNRDYKSELVKSKPETR
jgi:NADH-quinone oxidoreductase subunit C